MIEALQRWRIRRKRSNPPPTFRKTDCSVCHEDYSGEYRAHLESSHPEFFGPQGRDLIMAHLMQDRSLGNALKELNGVLKTKGW